LNGSISFMMKSLILTTMTVLSLSAPALADARMDAYESCWADIAGKGTDDAVTEKDAPILDAAVARANKECNKLARAAAKTNGKDAVNEMWHYMEVQFYNGHLRESQ